MKTTVTSPPPHSRQPSWTSPACTRGICPYLFRPAVGDAPGGVGATPTSASLDGAIDQTIDGNRRIGIDVARGHEVDDIAREFHRIVGMDEVPGIRIDLQDRPVTGARHPVMNGTMMSPAEVLQPVERRCRE